MIAAPRDIVLVVEDSPDNLGMLTTALEAAGMTVLVAMDGASALGTAEEITPDIVLMDAVMPGIDGFETTRLLKRDAALAHVPVIFMTGLSETWHVVKGLEAGGVDYVTKPISPDELIARMRVHLANARATQGARMALDATGRFLLACDASGHAVWSTPQARRLVSEVFPEISPHSDRLPAAMRAAISILISQGTSPSVVDSAVGRALQISLVGQTGPDQYLLRVAENQAAEPENVLKQALRLTAREAEVLVWIARGKPNKDIAEILGLSPRTVNKHLEQIYAKLGVENRASAAATAIRALQGER